MNEENQVISIDGKEIDCSKLSGEKVVKLYEQLKERELILFKKKKKLQEKYNFEPEINSSEIIG